MDFLNELKTNLEEKKIPPQIYEIFYRLYKAYIKTLTTANIDYSEHVKIFPVYLDLVKKQLANPYTFEPYHQKITKPFNHDQFGIDLFEPMVDTEKSVLLQPENLDRMEAQIAAKENVILLANHQTEVDPQLINIRLKERYPDLMNAFVIVAGNRVISDPVAVPLSLGCNMLCIYSKRYIDNPPEKKEEKLLHNGRTMQRMKELLSTGGKFIYVAPSGGRDRKGADGTITLSPFDPSAIEMFNLMTRKSGTPAHFYPLALKTYDILPPPETVKVELGEFRICSREPAHFAFGDEIDMQNFPGNDLKDRQAKRSARAIHIFNLVKSLYNELP